MATGEVDVEEDNVAGHGGDDGVGFLHVASGSDDVEGRVGLLELEPDAGADEWVMIVDDDDPQVTSLLRGPTAGPGGGPAV